MDNDAQQLDTSDSPRMVMRPVLLVDEQAGLEYSGCLGRFLVGLADESYPSMVVCPPKVNLETIAYPTLELITYPILNFSLLWRQNRALLCEKLARFKPTILHCFGSGKVGLTGHLAAFLDIPYVATFNQPVSRFSAPRIDSGYCASLIASSRPVASNLQDVYPSFAPKIRRINNGTFVSDTCSCFSVPLRIPSIIVAGRLDDFGHFSVLLDALKQLSTDGFEFLVGITGRGSAEHEIYRRIRSLGLVQKVSLVPPMQPVRSIFSGADIFVQLPHAFEYGANLMEAIAVGMAVAAPAGTAQDVLVQDQTAVLFDPHNRISIYDNIRKLLIRQEFARRLAVAAQIQLKRNYSVSRMIISITQAYDDAQAWYKNESAQRLAEQKAG